MKTFHVLTCEKNFTHSPRMKGLNCASHSYMIKSQGMLSNLGVAHSSQHWRMKLKLSWSSWNIYFPGKCSMSKKIWWSEIQKKWIPGNVLARCAGDGGFAVEWFPRSCPQPDRLVCPRGLWLLFFFVYSFFFSRKKCGGFHRIITASNRDSNLNRTWNLSLQVIQPFETAHVRELPSFEKTNHHQRCFEGGSLKWTVPCHSMG